MIGLIIGAAFIAIALVGIAAEVYAIMLECAV
jgi:hypothetical protein